MKKIQKSLIASLSAILLIGVVGCSTTDVSPPETPNPPSTGEPTTPTTPTAPLENTTTEAQLKALEESKFYEQALLEFPEVSPVEGYTDVEIRAALYTAHSYLHTAFTEDPSSSFFYNGGWRNDGYSTEPITALFGAMFTPTYTDNLVNNILKYAETEDWDARTTTLGTNLNNTFGWFDIAMFGGLYAPSEQCLNSTVSCVTNVEIDTNWEYIPREDKGDILLLAPDVRFVIEYVNPETGELFLLERKLTDHRLTLVRDNTGWTQLDEEGSFPFLINQKSSQLETEILSK